MELDAHPYHCCFQCGRALLIEEWEQRVPAIENVDLYAEHSERAGILAADDARSDHAKALRQALQREDLVGVVDQFVPERELRRMKGGGPGGDDDGIAGDVRSPTRPRW